MSLYSLVIEEEHNAIEHLFYNAIGGKDKCLSFHECLVNQNKDKVVDRFVNLKAFLTYEDGQYVSNQDVLEVKEDSKFIIDSTPAHIRFRINEVSSHHQGRRFRVMVTPIEMSTPMLLTPVFCAPVEVKSKVLKPVRPREVQTDMSNESDLQSYSNKRSKIESPLYAKLTKSGSNTSTRSDTSSNESIECLVSQIIPVVKSVQETLAAYQIQKTSVSFPILCRFSLNASQFLNDMTMLGDLLQHDKDTQPVIQHPKPTFSSSSEKSILLDHTTVDILNETPMKKIKLTRSRSHIIESEEREELHCVMNDIGVISRINLSNNGLVHQNVFKTLK